MSKREIFEKLKKINGFKILSWEKMTNISEEKACQLVKTWDTEAKDGTL